MKVNRILIPTDLSEQSIAALKLANFFTDIYGSKIDLIHVVPFSLYMSESIDNLGLPFDMDKDIYPKVLEHAQTQLEKYAKEHIKNKFIGEIKVMVDRKPSVAIAQYANENEYDLLLMSARGAHESTFFRGSITEKVMRQSKIPVLTVNEDYFKKGFERIVTPIDLSALSFSAIPLAFELAYQFDATLELLYVNELYSGDGYGFVAPSLGISNHESANALKVELTKFFISNSQFGLALESTAEENSFRLIKSEGASSISMPIKVIIERGISASRVITEYANDNADLLIMTTHGRTGFSRFFMGSTAGQVVQHADVSMLTVRPENIKLS